MRSILLLVVILASGCELFFDDGGKRPEQCEVVATCPDEPAITPPLRDPELLGCTPPSQQGCDPACEPVDDRTGVAPIPPEQSWPVCGNACETLAETECAARSECRVVKDARCMIEEDCITDFLGCFAVDGAPNPNIDCFAMRDGWSCSRSNNCTALHERGTAGCTGEACPRPFGLCIPEGSSPGDCQSPISCDALPPACPTGTTPGRANSCWTGACIPTRLCEKGPA